jgi:hypothetical protein
MRIKITWRDGAYYVSEPAWDGGEVVPASDHDALAAQMAKVEAERDDYRQRWTDTSIALRALACQPHAPNDHMTACDRTMGDSHPCTCTANDARVMLAAVLPAPPAATTHNQESAP